MENAIAPGADGFVAIDFSGADDSYRRRVVKHDPYLYRRGVGSQQHIAGRVAPCDKKGILHITSRMVGRKVQQVEVISVKFKFRSGCNAEAHCVKNLLHVAQYLLHGMFAAGVMPSSRQGKIQSGSLIVGLCGEGRFCCRQFFVGTFFERIEQLAYSWPFIRSNSFKLSEKIGNEAFANSIFKSECFEILIALDPEVRDFLLQTANGIFHEKRGNA